MADLHLIVGSTGAGKTTYSLGLAETLGAVRFSIDEWMTALFWKDSPQPIEFAWAVERVVRCETQILATAAQLAKRGVPALLDLGFTTREQRDRVADRAARAGLSLRMHFLDVPAGERWRRVQTRNAEKGETWAMTVDRRMFDFMETLWEAPDSAELALRDGLRITD